MIADIEVVLDDGTRCLRSEHHAAYPRERSVHRTVKGFCLWNSRHNSEGKGVTIYFVVTPSGFCRVVRAGSVLSWRRGAHKEQSELEGRTWSLESPPSSTDGDAADTARSPTGQFIPHDRA